MAKRNNDSEIKKPTTQEEARDEYRRREVNRCVNDFLYFAKSLTPKAFYNETPDFHHEVTKLMMDRSKEQICIQAPRGFAKSTLNVRFILHHILFDPGNKVVIIQSKTQPEAINRLDAIKNILEYSQYFKDVFGYCGQAAPQTKTWTEKKIKTGLAGFEFSIKAIGTGMPARGVLETGEDLSDTRITLFLLDDPDDEENTLTKDQMIKNYDKFAGSKEGLDPRTGRVICIGTPVRQGCIVDRLYGATGWESKKYQAYWKENGEIKLLWGERRSYEWLQAKMAEYEYQGRISKFYSEYMCEIVGEADQLFKEEYIQYYEGHVDAKQDGGVLHITKINDREVNLSKPVNIFIGIDPASSTKQTADYSVTM